MTKYGIPIMNNKILQTVKGANILIRKTDTAWLPMWFAIINEGKIPIKYVLTDILIIFLYFSSTNYLQNISEDSDSILKEFKDLQ